MAFSRIRKLVVPVVLLGLFCSTPVFATEAKLTDIIVTNTRDDLLIYLTVDGAFPPKIEEAILSGIPATFSFFVSLYQKRSFWFDKKIADLTLTHSIKFNRLKNEYTIERSWQTGLPVVVTSFTHAQKLMAAVDNLKVASLTDLVKGQQYQIRAKAELEKLRLPLKPESILVFVSLWDFETDWYTIDFTY